MAKHKIKQTALRDSLRTLKGHGDVPMDSLPMGVPNTCARFTTFDK